MFLLHRLDINGRHPGDACHMPIDMCALKGKEKSMCFLCSSDEGNTSFQVLCLLSYIIAFELTG